MTTMNPPSEDVKDMLEDSGSGLGLVSGTDLFINTQPNTPDNVVTLYDTSGMSQMQYGLERPNLQILVRNRTYLSGYELIKDIKYYLHEARNNEIWNNARYISIMCRSDIGFIGLDANNRFEWSLNFQIYRTGL